MFREVQEFLREEVVYCAIYASVMIQLKKWVVLLNLKSCLFDLGEQQLRSKFEKIANASVYVEIWISFHIAQYVKNRKLWHSNFSLTY